MSLVWHMARKDLRRMVLPVVLWIAFIAAMTIWFQFASPVSGGQSAPETVSWLAVLEIWSRLVGIVQFAIGYLLAGALFLEDPLVGANHFWMTRPIANWRLIAAKIAAAAILLLVAPAVALAAVWLGNGFTLREAMWAMGEFALSQGVVTLPALLVASVSRTLAQFLFFSVGFYAACFLGGLLVAMGLHFAEVPAPFRPSRNFALNQLGPLMAACVLALAQQFRRHRRARTWLTIGIALPVALILVAARPWDFGGRVGGGENRKQVPGGVRSEPEMTWEGLSLRVYSLEGSKNQPIQASLTLALLPATLPDGSIYAPAMGRV
ncbi:MAG: hypothetical protein ABIR80_14615, partial [Opitutaceae bacterium]